MSKYYMIITNEADYKCDVKNNFQCAGFPERFKNSLLGMEPGDKIVFYVTGKSKFMALSEVCGKYFFSQEQYWSDEYELYPDRIKIKPILHINDVKDGVYIKEIWDDLEFIKNKNKWGSQVMGSFRKINEHDYQVIEKAIKGRLQ